MRVLTFKTRTPANIKIPGYPKYTIKFKYYFHKASGVYGENGTPNANYANIYTGNLSALASLAQIYI